MSPSTDSVPYLPGRSENLQILPSRRRRTDTQTHERSKSAPYLTSKTPDERASKAHWQTVSTASTTAGSLDTGGCTSFWPRSLCHPRYRLCPQVQTNLLW